MSCGGSHTYLNPQQNSLEVCISFDLQEVKFQIQERNTSKDILIESFFTGNIPVFELSYSMATMTIMLSLPAYPRVA